MAIRKGTGIELTKSEAIVDCYFVTGGVNMDIDIVRRAAITRENCFKEVELHFGLTNSTLNQLAREFRVGQLTALNIDPVTLQVIQ